MFSLRMGSVRTIALVLGIVLALVGVTATVIYAQGGTITACVNNSNGNVRIVGSSGDCRKSERAIQWSLSGGQGPSGGEGPAGPQGPAGVSGYEMIQKNVSVPPGGFLRDTANCPAGKRVLGGGAQITDAGAANFHTLLQESGPGSLNGGVDNVWLVAIQNNDGVDHVISIFAICANVS